MGQLNNCTNDGDPINTVYVAGFNTYEDCSKYMENSESLKPLFTAEIDRGTNYVFSADAVVLFYDFEATGKRIFYSMTKCFSDLTLNISSYGAQMLLEKP